MQCAEFVKGVHEYFLGELDGEESRRFDEHAASCPDCGRLMETARELSCREFVEFLNLYLDDELDADRKDVFERHLTICSDCTNYLDSYRKTLHLSALALSKFDAAILPEPPDDLIRAVLDALDT